MDILKPEVCPGLLDQEEWENVLSYYETASDFYIVKDQITDLINLNLWFMQYIEPVPYYQKDFDLWYERETLKRRNLRSAYTSNLSIKILGDSLSKIIPAIWKTSHKRIIEDVKRNYKPVTVIKLKMKKK